MTLHEAAEMFNRHGHEGSSDWSVELFEGTPVAQCNDAFLYEAEAIAIAEAYARLPPR